jgi:glutathione S-transferase
MILYDYPRAPNPMRVNLFIYEKNITIKRILVDLSKHENLKPKFLKLNSWGTVPFLLVKDQVIKETIAICRYLECIQPSPKLFGQSSLEQAKIEMYRRKIEFDGMQAVGESFRNSSKAFAGRAIAGPSKIAQIPELIQRGKVRAEMFFDFLNKTLKINKYVAGNKFSIADIDAYVTLTFAKWIKIDGTIKRKYINLWKEKLDKRKAFKKYNNLFIK